MQTVGTYCHMTVYLRVNIPERTPEPILQCLSPISLDTGQRQSVVCYRSLGTMCRFCVQYKGQDVHPWTS